MRAKTRYSSCSWISADSPGHSLLSWARPERAERGRLSARTEIEIYLSVLTLSRMLWQTLQTSAQGQAVRTNTHTHMQTHECETTVVLLWLKSLIWKLCGGEEVWTCRIWIVDQKALLSWVTAHLNEPRHRTQLALEMKLLELHNKCNYTLKYFSLPSKILDTLLVFLDLRGNVQKMLKND